ncbi:hypothetical protein JET64_06655 [Pseudomonas putida]|nr:hypothetical protein [Pseudomonas putida]
MTPSAHTAKPLLVYLDSSDISILSNPESLKKPDLLQAREKLEKLVSAGSITIRYSLAHIMEALPLAKESAELGKLRLELIKKLCGNKVFLDPITIIHRELTREPLESVINDDGLWFPSMDKIWRTEVDELDEPPKNRADRRAARYQIKKGFASKDPNALELTNQFPIKKSATLDMFSKYGAGSSFGTALQQSTKDLDFLFRWHMKNWSTSTKFSLAVREAGEGLKKIISDGSKQVRQQYEHLILEKANQIYISEKLGVLAKEIADQAPRDFITSLAEDLAPPASEPDIEKSPSTTAFAKVGAQIFLASLAATKNSRKPRHSDLGDLIHAVYLPYVDIFSADGATSDYIRKAQVNSNAMIVTGIPALISKIESVL